jgi:hypothetical protein
MNPAGSTPRAGLGDRLDEPRVDAWRMLRCRHPRLDIRQTCRRRMRKTTWTASPATAHRSEKAFHSSDIALVRPETETAWPVGAVVCRGAADACREVVTAATELKTCGSAMASAPPTTWTAPVANASARPASASGRGDAARASDSRLDPPDSTATRDPRPLRPTRDPPTPAAAATARRASALAPLDVNLTPQ